MNVNNALIKLIALSDDMSVEVADASLEAGASSLWGEVRLAKPFTQCLATRKDGKSSLVAIFDMGVGASRILGELRSMREAGMTDTVIAAWTADVSSDLLGRSRVRSDIIRICLGSFRGLIVGDGSMGVLYRRGPDPSPWDVSGDPDGNPITWAIRDGLIPGIDPAFEYEELLKKDRGLAKQPDKKQPRGGSRKKLSVKRDDIPVSYLPRYKVTESSYKAFMKSSARACPLFLEKNIW